MLEWVVSVGIVSLLSMICLTRQSCEWRVNWGPFITPSPPISYLHPLNINNLGPDVTCQHYTTYTATAMSPLHTRKNLFITLEVIINKSFKFENKLYVNFLPELLPLIFYKAFGTKEKISLHSWMNLATLSFLNTLADCVNWFETETCFSDWESLCELTQGFDTFYPEKLLRKNMQTTLLFF